MISHSRALSRALARNHAGQGAIFNRFSSLAIFFLSFFSSFSLFFFSSFSLLFLFSYDFPCQKKIVFDVLKKGFSFCENSVRCAGVRTASVVQRGCREVLEYGPLFFRGLRLFPAFRKIAYGSTFEILKKPNIYLREISMNYAAFSQRFDV